MFPATYSAAVAAAKTATSTRRRSAPGTFTSAMGATRLESPQALQLRLFQTMGEIAVNQNSTIILPVPIDLLRPYLSGPDGSRGDYEARAQRERLEEEEEAKRLYEKTVGDVSREVSSEEVPTEMPDGEANR